MPAWWPELAAPVELPAAPGLLAAPATAAENRSNPALRRNPESRRTVRVLDGGFIPTPYSGNKNGSSARNWDIFNILYSRRLPMKEKRSFILSFVAVLLLVMLVPSCDFFGFGDPPAAPSELSASVSGTTITLAWIDNSDNERGFELERSDGDSWNFAQITASIGANTTQYTDSSGITEGGAYWYRIRAVNNSGESAWSDTRYVIASSSVSNDQARMGCIYQAYVNTDGKLWATSQDPGNPENKLARSEIPDASGQQTGTAIDTATMVRSPDSAGRTDRRLAEPGFRMAPSLFRRNASARPLPRAGFPCIFPLILLYSILTI
jgi:hypothetical protein